MSQIIHSAGSIIVATSPNSHFVVRCEGTSPHFVVSVFTTKGPAPFLEVFKTKVDFKIKTALIGNGGKKVWLFDDLNVGYNEKKYCLKIEKDDKPRRIDLPLKKIVLRGLSDGSVFGAVKAVVEDPRWCKYSGQILIEPSIMGKQQYPIVMVKVNGEKSILHEGVNKNR